MPGVSRSWPALRIGPGCSSSRKNTASLGISQFVLRGLEENLVPAEIMQILMEHHRNQIFSTLGMTGELFRLLELFAANDIPALIVKGPALAMQAYGDPTMRSYGDLDFLVRQRNIRRATESLQAAGFQATVPLSAIDAGKIPGQYLFCKTDTKLIVELHNDFTLRYFPRPLPIEEFFGRQIRVCLDGREAPTLSVEDQLVLICIHGAKHLWERLIWIADVAALVTRQTGIVGRVRGHRQKRCEPTICCIRGCFSLRTCYMHISPKTFTRSFGRMPWPRSLSREFSAGCLARGIRHQLCSNAQRFACVCAVAYWRHLLIFCDSLFLPRKKIGKRAEKSAITDCSTDCAARSAWHVSMAAAAKRRRLENLPLSSCGNLNVWVSFKRILSL